MFRVLKINSFKKCNLPSLILSLIFQIRVQSIELIPQGYNIFWSQYTTSDRRLLNDIYWELIANFQRYVPR